MRSALVFSLLLAGSGLAAYAAPIATPVVETPSRYKGTATSRNGAISSPWWSIFHDAELDRLLRLAIANNQDLQSAVARIDEARAETRRAASDLYPHVEAPLHIVRQRITDTGPVIRSRIVGGFPFPVPTAGATGAALPNSFAGQQATTTYDDYQAELSLTYEVDVFGRIRHRVGQARASALASAADREAVELSLTAETASRYVNLRSLDAQIEVLRRTFHLRADAVQIQHERVKAGAVSELDLSRAELEQANTEADLSDALRLRTEAENQLAALCGQVASGFHLASRPVTNLTPPDVPPGVPSALLMRRPDLVEAGQRLAATAEGVKAARADFFPTFNFTGNYGYESAEFGQLFEERSHVWTIGGAVQIPIFEGGRNSANLQAARARREEALSAYRQTALTAFKEAENALVALQQRRSQAEARARAATSAERVLKLTQDRYQEGAITYFEVIDAERGELSAALQQVQTVAARFLATIDLIRALGGGYEGPAEASRTAK